MISFTAKQIAEVLNGEIRGNESETVQNVSGLETAKKGDLCFVCDEKYLPLLEHTDAGIVLLSRSITYHGNTSACIILVDNARAAMAQLLQMVAEVLHPRKKGIEPGAFIAEGVEVPEDAYIGAMAYIGSHVQLGKGVQIYPHTYLGENVKIGDNTTIYAGAKVYYNCTIGSECIIHAGAVIGADGFGFEPDSNGVLQKVPQIGNVVIEDDVEIGANTCIDRAMMGETRIRKNTKIDNLVQIGHNVQLGESTVMCGQSGIAGSTKVGNHCMLTGQVGISGHLEITDGCIIGAKSGVTHNLTKPGTYLGVPAMEANRTRRILAAMKHLPEIYQQSQK